MSNHDLSFARALVREARAIALSRAFRSHAASAKGQAVNLVTETDVAVEKALVAAIRSERPTDEILGEESGINSTATTPTIGSAHRRWILDPIDGTTNFAHGLPFFVISVGLEIDGSPAVGVVDAPALGWTFWAAAGEGAFWSRTPEASDATQLHVSSTETLEAALLATGFPYDLHSNPRNNFLQFERLYRASQGIRRVGAAALDFAMVAAGWFDGFWEMRLKPWDAAAGRLLVTEAGGRVTNLVGDRFDLGVGDVVASNGKIHAAMIRTLDDQGGSL